jgi:O-antigen biosynthesis protein
VYDAGLADAVTRPILRCLTPAGAKDEFLPGALLGRAVWMGKIPDKTSAILVSPAKTPGPFAFRVAMARPLSLAKIAARGWDTRPKYVLLGLGLGLIGDTFEAERRFRRALHSTRLKDYRRWAEARRRTPEWDGFDSLPSAAADGPRILVIASRSEPGYLAHLSAQLRAQPWPRWSLAAPGSTAQGGVIALGEDATLAACLAGLRPRDLVIAVRPREDWSPEALAIAGAAAMRDDSDIYYGDEECDAEGGLRLKPDWSPILARYADLIGRAWVARADWARRTIGARPATEIADRPLPVDKDLRATHLELRWKLGDGMRKAA